MTFHLFHDRELFLQGLTPSRLIFEEEPTTSAEVFWKKDEIGAEIEHEEALPIIQQKLIEHYGPEEKFQGVIQDYVNRLFPKNDPMNMGARVVKEETGLYHEAFYRKGGILDSFRKEVGDLEDQKERSIDQIEDRTEEMLDRLKDQVERTRAAVRREPQTVPGVPRYADDDPSVLADVLGPLLEPFGDHPLAQELLHSPNWIEYQKAQEKTQTIFERYLEAMLEAYMTPELYESDLGERLRAGIAAQTEGQINYLFREGKANQKSLMEMAKKLKEQLQEYGRFDGVPGDLSVRDAHALVREAEPLDKNFLKKLETGNFEAILEALERRRILDPQAWHQAVALTAETLIKDAVRDGNEKAFIQKVRESREEKYQKIGQRPPSPDITDFQGAKIYFWNEMVNVRAQAGAREVMEFFNEFDRALNQGRMALFEKIKHPGMRKLAFEEREKLLQGVTIPRNDYSRSVVNFMRGSREDREAILKDEDKRQALFQGIQIIRSDYEKYYQDGAKNLPKTLRTSSKDPDRGPERADELARAKALVILAEEAKWVVGNFSGSYSSALESVKPERRGNKDRVKADLDFRDVRTKYETGYQSIAAQNGFNGKDMALTGLKVLAGFTAFANIMNSFEGGIGSFEKIEEAIEKMAKNPFIYAGLGTVYGIDRYREDPRVASIMTVSPGRRAEIITHIKLRALARKRGQERVKGFIGNPLEWDVMKGVSRGVAQKLIKNAKDRKGPTKNQVTKEDLKRFVPAAKLPPTWVSLKDDGGTAQERFHFYNKFLTNEETNVLELQEYCNHWL